MWYKWQICRLIEVNNILFNQMATKKIAHIVSIHIYVAYNAQKSKRLKLFVFK